MHRGERRRTEARAEPGEHRIRFVGSSREPRGVLAQGRKIGVDPALGGAPCGQPAGGVVDRGECRSAQLVDAGRPRSPLGGRVGIGVVEPLLQEERLAKPTARRVDGGAQVVCGGGAELRLGIRDLALRLSHGVVGLHDADLRLHFGFTPCVECGTLAPSTEAAQSTAAPAIATAAAANTTMEGNHQSPSGMLPESRTCRWQAAATRL